MSKKDRDARYYKKHRVKIRKRKRKYDREYCGRPEVKKQRQNYNRLRNTGVTPEQFEAKLAEQGNVCALCDLPFVAEETPVADHDHNEGTFRGVLHHRCNRGIGQFNDDPILLAKAVRYLLQFIR
jgi:hypothetical protein